MEFKEDAFITAKDTDGLASKCIQRYPDHEVMFSLMVKYYGQSKAEEAFEVLTRKDAVDLIRERLICK